MTRIQNRLARRTSTAILATLLAAIPAGALDFEFSVTNVDGNFSGTIRGRVLGLEEGGPQTADAVFIDDTGGLPGMLDGPSEATLWPAQVANSFIVTNGEITLGAFAAQNGGGGTADVLVLGPGSGIPTGDPSCCSNALTLNGGSDLIADDEGEVSFTPLLPVPSLSAPGIAILASLLVGTAARILVSRRRVG